MIVFGWGQGAKVLGEGFLHTCANCGNTGRFHVVEQAAHVSLYFVPVAKFARKYFYICPICSCGATVPDRAICQRILANALRDPRGPDQDLVRLLEQARDR
jgi:hypothetical protein